MLTTQYRMPPYLATELISPAFYKFSDKDSGLENGIDVTPASHAHPFVNPFLWASNGEPLSLIWLDVPFERLTSGNNPDLFARTNARTLFDNIAEAKAIAHFLREIRLADGDQTHSDLFLMSPYKVQGQMIARELGTDFFTGERRSSNWIRADQTVASEQRRIIRTVTSAMGDECDVAILSLVRTMDLAVYDEMRARQMCLFLAEPGNLNVALSRAKRLQVICGDWKFFRKLTSTVAATDSDPLFHLRRVVQSVEAMMQRGHAKLIDGTSQ